jgi:hypothetical protein
MASRIATAVATYLATLKAAIRQPSIVHEQITLAAGANKDYNLATLIGATSGTYDMRSVLISAKILDTDSGSPTYNFYINSEPLITTAVNAAGLVRLNNSHNTSLTVFVTISKPSKTAP